MTMKALFSGFGIVMAGVFACLSAHAVSSADIFINEVTPPQYAIKGKTSDVMPTIGNRRDVLNGLRTLQAHQVQALAALRRLPKAKAATASIVAQIKELKLRRQFYDQVIFSVDAKWNDGPLKAFLEKEFLSRAQNDIDSDSDDAEAASDTLWKFYTYLSVAIRDLPEPREDLVSFMQGYVEFSSISKPKPPAEYVAQRAYSNGLVSQAAHTMDQDEVGDGVERLVHARGLDKTQRRASAGAAPAQIELRMKVDMTPPPGAVMPSVERN